MNVEPSLSAEPSPSELPSVEPSPPVEKGPDWLVWTVEPTLEYDEIKFFHAFGFIGYTDVRMFYLDGKTGDVLEETGPEGGFRSLYIWLS